jgi:hypothetical protein
LFVAEYEVERTSDAGEVMVRYTVFSDCTWSETIVRSRNFWIVCSWVWG